ncbi:hypothetical protein MKX01_042740, partial [Papaver californicum]
DLEYETATEKSNTKPDGLLNKDVVAQKLEQVFKRIEFIDALSTGSRADSILLVSSQTSVILEALESSSITSVVQSEVRFCFLFM